MPFEIYQTILVNFGYDVYTGDTKDLAFDAAKRSGFECSILLDGKLIAWYSPISGFKEFANA